MVVGGGTSKREEKREEGFSGEKGRGEEEKNGKMGFLIFQPTIYTHFPNYQNTPPWKFSIKSLSFPNSLPNHLNFQFDINTPISNLLPTQQLILFINLISTNISTNKY